MGIFSRSCRSPDFHDHVGSLFLTLMFAPLSLRTHWLSYCYIHVGYVIPNLMFAFLFLRACWFPYSNAHVDFLTITCFHASLFSRSCWLPYYYIYVGFLIFKLIFLLIISIKSTAEVTSSTPTIAIASVSIKKILYTQSNKQISIFMLWNICVAILLNVLCAMIVTSEYAGHRLAIC